MTTTTPAYTVFQLNDAVNHATAFPTWKEMEDSLKAGYVPTLRDDYGDREHKQAVRLIRKHMRYAGRRYFDGTKLVG